MDTEQRPQSSAKPAYRTERIIASLVMAWVIILTSYMIFQERALSQESMYFLKILISLSGAVMLATLPGFFDISYGVGGLTIRAAGGAAAFVFIYTQSPNIPNFNTPKAAPYTIAPATTRPGTTSTNHRYDSDTTPVLVALSIDPLGMMPGASSTTSQVTLTGEPASNSEQNAGGGGVILSGGGGAVLGVSTVASTLVEVVRRTATEVASSALQLLERLAAALRSAASWAGAKATAMIDQLRALNAMPASQFQAFVASTAEAATDLLNSAVAPATGAVDQLNAELGELPLVSGLSETARDVPGVLNATVEHTVGVVGDLVSGVLHSPKDTLALTGKAVSDLTGGLADTTKDVLASTRGLTQSVNAQVSAITEKLNDVAPVLVAPISPVLGKLDAATGTLHDIGGDITSALPPLTAALDGVDNVKLPGLPLPAGRLLESRAEEVRGCTNCLLPPLDLGGHGERGLRGGLGGGLSGIGLARGGDGAGGGSGGGGLLGGGAGLAGGGLAGGGLAGGGAGLGGAGGGGAGPVSSAVGGIGSAVGNTTRGLLGSRR
jgi:hypothetical protein